MQFLVCPYLIGAIFAAFCGTAHSAESVALLGRDFTPHPLLIASEEKALASADLNNDGRSDLVVLESRQNRCVVFLGSESGLLLSNGSFAAGEWPTDVATTDVDMDGNIDLVIANHETKALTILLGDGAGTFVQASNSPLHVDVEPHVHVVRSVDLNGDNIEDLIVDSRNENGLIVLKGKGNGVFAEPGVLVDMGGDPYRGMAVGDINGDKVLDLVSPNEDSIGVALNTSGNEVSFQLSEPILIEAPFALDMADFNADGNLDVVVASDGRTSQVRILRGDGRGDFDAGDDPISAPRGAKSIATGDITGDGTADIVVTGWSSSEIVIVNGRDISDISRVKLDGIDNPWGVLIADLNGDSFGDLAIADGMKPVAKILMSRPAIN